MNNADKKTPPTSSLESVRLIRTNRPGVELGMELNMESIAEPLRKVAAGVFEEMDSLK